MMNMFYIHIKDLKNILKKINIFFKDGPLINIEEDFIEKRVSSRKRCFLVTQQQMSQEIHHLINSNIWYFATFTI
jgi:hypothetical protein